MIQNIDQPSIAQLQSMVLKKFWNCSPFLILEITEG